MVSEAADSRLISEGETLTLLRSAYRRCLAVVVVVAAFVGLTITPAHANDTGDIFQVTFVAEDWGTSGGCLNSEIGWDLKNWAWVSVWDPPGACWDGYVWAGAYFGAYTSGFRDGSWCGWTDWVWSDAAYQWWGIGGYQMCSNPSESQTFYTTSYSAYWDKSSSSYFYAPSTLTSPNLTA